MSFSIFHGLKSEGTSISISYEGLDSLVAFCKGPNLVVLMSVYWV